MRHVCLCALSIPVMVVIGAGCNGTGLSEGQLEIVESSQEAVTLALSGRVMNTSGVGIPGVTVMLAGSSQATRVTGSNGSYSFGVLAPGSYSLRPVLNGCSFAPDVVNLNNVTFNRTQDFVGSGSACSAQGQARALMLVDPRLYDLLRTEIDQYRAAASTRRGFAVELRAVSNIDDYSPQTVRDYVIQEKAANPALEGVLYIGNIKLPSFYKTRDDLPNTRLYPNYLQDLDAVFTRDQAPGTIDPKCDESNAPYCTGKGPLTVPPHDFDGIAKGTNPDPELWAAFLPVGVAGTSNTYANFVAQLRPFFTKVMSFYNRQLVPNGRYYFVSNDIGERFPWTWDAFGGRAIDFYGKPGPQGETGYACLSNGQNLCYQRWATESFATGPDFESYYRTFPSLEGGWLTPEVLIPHMNAALYDVVEINEHGNEIWSVIDSSQARALTNAGLLVALNGCGVGGFYQPGSPSSVDTVTAASDNLSLAYLYGSSKAIAVLGDPTLRGHYANHPVIYREMKVNHAYLGQAHRLRMIENYSRAGDSAVALKEWASEMLFGDPFMDLN